MRKWLFALVLLQGIALAKAPANAQTAGINAGVIRPGDVVRLRVWREADLSGEFSVDETGAVVLPKLGRLLVGTESATSLRARLEDSYGEFLRNPSVEIVVLRRINVLGSVKNPGLFAVDPTMTVADVIAMAGGVTPQGEPDKVEFVRGTERRITKLIAESSIDDLLLRSGDQLYVPERRWIARNAAVVAAALTASVSLIIALIR